MSVKALVCTAISNHPNADLLSVYTFSHLDESLTIVANSDNTYELNDVAAIVTSGMLKDGTVIKKVSVRGVLSDGMALGKVSVEPGTDLSDQYLMVPTPATSPRFIPWPHIGSLFNIRKYLNEYSLARKVTYKGSVKLDGTNAAVQILPNKVFSAQSRNNIITPQKDNMGFATFAYQHEEYWKALSKEKMVTVFGEYCFYHNTPILLADGSKRRIGDIVNNKEELEVLTYNFETGKLEPKLIIGWSRRDLIDNNEWLTITVKRRHRGGKSTNIIVTRNHMIFCKRNNNIVEVPAGDIVIGDILFVSGKMLSYYQKQFIMGSLLGDGCFSEIGNFTCSHSDKAQPWYNDFVENLLLDISNTSNMISGHGSPMRRVSTKSFPEIRCLYDQLMKDGTKTPNKKYLDKLHPPAFAAWYMDDGSLAGGHGGRQYQCDISTLGFTKECNEELCEWFCEHGFHCTVQQNGRENNQYFLRLSPDGAEAFYRMIAPYVLPKFDYKLPPYLREVPKIDWESRNNVSGIIETTVTEIVAGNKYNKPSMRHGYDITVEDNHNYFANNILVHNCGKGIQSRCSVSQIKNRVFAVFAIMIGDPQIDTAYYIVEPSKMMEFLGKKPEDVYVASWYKTPITLDYNSVDELQKSADIINEWVAEVEKCDPWVKENFGIEGLGEGLVFYPDISTDGTIEYDMYKDLVFKAKGDEHKVVNTKKAAQVNPESAASVAEFAKLFLTEARFEQFAKGVYDVKNTGNFLKAFGEDVKRESVAELEASNLEWKDVSKAISEGAKNWYMAKAKSL